MADLSTLARPYAKAAFELAKEEGTLKQWGEALDRLAAAVQSSEVSGLIGHPAVAKASLAGVLSSLIEPQVAEKGASLVKLLVENGRLKSAPFIAEQFEELRAAAESRVDVEISTASEVAPRDQEQLADAVGRRLERDVVVSWAVDESLIAGAVIRAGDLVIDGSAKGELDKLRTALTA